MMSGEWVEIVFTYEDGTQSTHGRWLVPRDTEYRALDEEGASIGYTILYEIAKQPTKTVAKVEIRKCALE
jgi:hypothetical protein